MDHGLGAGLRCLCCAGPLHGVIACTGPRVRTKTGVEQRDAHTYTETVEIRKD